MIYLLEDRAERRNLYNNELENYKDLIKVELFNKDTATDLAEFIDKQFQDVTCVIFHKSYAFKFRESNYDDIKKLFKNRGAKVVTFSGGVDQGNIDNDGNLIINADIMYKNLPTFLQHLRDTKKIDLQILLWGKEYVLNALLSLQYNLSKVFFVAQDLEAPISTMDVHNIKRKVNNHIRDLSLPFSSDMNAEIDQKLDSDTLTWDAFRNIVQTAVDKTLMNI